MHCYWCPHFISSPDFFPVDSWPIAYSTSPLECIAGISNSTKYNQNQTPGLLQPVPPTGFSISSNSGSILPWVCSGQTHGDNFDSLLKSHTLSSTKGVQLHLQINSSLYLTTHHCPPGQSHYHQLPELLWNLLPVSCFYVLMIFLPLIQPQYSYQIDLTKSLADYVRSLLKDPHNLFLHWPFPHLLAHLLCEALAGHTA